MSVSLSDAPAAPCRVVLDTNVCLDLFVFGDAAVAALARALADGRAEAVTDARCREEWCRVLTYPQLALGDAARAAALAAHDRWVRRVEETREAPPGGIRLPRCADPDDQKFLELAWATGAAWLLSKDREVLRLGRRTARDGLFAIATPTEWLRLQGL